MEKNNNTGIDNLGVLLLRYRIANGLRQKDVAKAIGCHQYNLSLFENGGYIPAKLRQRVADFIGVKTEENKRLTLAIKLLNDDKLYQDVINLLPQHC